MSPAQRERQTSPWWKDVKLGGVKLARAGKDQINFPALLIGVLGVDRDYRRRGIASRMIETAIDYANEAAITIGCRLVHVDSDKTEAAMNLYASMGFTKASGQEKRSRTWMYLDLGVRND